jgi:Rrf2 family protein
VLAVRRLAVDLQASEAHLAKVLQRLAKAELVHSTRGPRGGFALARKAETVALLDICTAIDGPIGHDACLFGTPVCRGECLFGHHLAEATRGLIDYLATTTVADLLASAPAANWLVG